MEHGRMDQPASGRQPLEQVTPVVDLCYPIIQGGTLEVDHGHALYLALRAACAGIARIPGLGVHAVRGLCGDRRGDLLLTDDSEVRLRIPAASAPLVQDLEGALLNVGGHGLRLGEPRLQPLGPVTALWARTLTIHFQNPFRAAAQAQLEQRFAQDFPWGALRILRARTIRFEGRQLIGFEAAVRNLTPQASLLLQSQGFGGRRALGCGLFVPFPAVARRKAS
jgi:CRISPR-associated protein Cas6